MAAFLITADIGLAGKFLMIIFIFQIIDPQFNIMQQGQILQSVQYRREAFAQRHLRVQAAVGLPQEREDLIFVLQTRRFLLYPLFQHRVTFGQFFRHIIQRRAQRCHLITPTDMCALSKITLTDGSRHRQQLFPRL